MSTRKLSDSGTFDRVPPDLVDAFFDRELDEGSREKFFMMLRSDLGTCGKVARAQRMISVLREPVEAPDLTASIMGEISRRRGFLPDRLRRMVKAGRLAVAACILLTLCSVAAIHRYAPDTFTLSEQPRPVSRVVTSGAQEAAAGVQQLAGAVDSVRARISEPAAELSRVITAEDLPEIEFGPELRSARVYLVGGLTPDGIAINPSLPGSQTVATYGGAGQDVRFVVPSVVYLEGDTARAVYPVNPSAGAPLPIWVGTWRQNLFLFEAAKAEAKHEVVPDRP